MRILCALLFGLVIACSDAAQSKAPDADSSPVASPPQTADSGSSPAANEAPLGTTSQAAETVEPDGSEGGGDGDDLPTEAGAGGTVAAADGALEPALEPEPGTEPAGGAGGATSLAPGEGGSGEIAAQPCAGAPDGSYCASDSETVYVYLCEAGAPTAITECPSGCYFGVCDTDTGSTSASGGKPTEYCDPCTHEHCSAQEDLCANAGDCAPLDECQAKWCAKKCNTGRTG